MDFTKHPLKIFFSYYKPHVGLFIADMICAFFMAAIDVAFPMFSRYALNTLIPNFQLQTFLILVALLFVVYVLIGQLIDFVSSIYGEVVYRFVRKV